MGLSCALTSLGLYCELAGNLDGGRLTHPSLALHIAQRRGHSLDLLIAKVLPSPLSRYTYHVAGSSPVLWIILSQLSLDQLLFHLWLFFFVPNPYTGSLPVIGSKDILHLWPPKPGTSLDFTDKNNCHLSGKEAAIGYDRRWDDGQNHAGLPTGARCLLPEFYSCNLG